MWQFNSLVRNASVYNVWQRKGRKFRAGRSGCVFENGGNVFIFEFKHDKSADEALHQIEVSGYAKPYEFSGKRIVKIGASFSTKERTLSEWKIVE